MSSHADSGAIGPDINSPQHRWHSLARIWRLCRRKRLPLAGTTLVQHPPSSVSAVSLASGSGSGGEGKAGGEGKGGGEDDEAGDMSGEGKGCSKCNIE